MAPAAAAFKQALDNTLTQCDNYCMMSVLEMIEKYIESKRRAWSQTTLRSERHRLRGLAAASAINGDPETLWRHLEAHSAPYARVTAWTRVGSFWQWAIEKGHVTNARNLYPEFRRENARLFRNTYQRKMPEITLAEARERVEMVKNPEARELGQEFLSSGVRWIDRERQTGDVVEGKGGKRRRVATHRTNGPAITYRAFLRAMKPTGIKPHDLRKIVATHLCKDGMNPADLCKVMGWNRFSTGESYIAAAKESELIARVKKALGE